MKTPRISIRLSAVLAVLSLAVGPPCFSAATAMGQGGAPNAQNIAVIDIGKILKNDDKFKQEMSALQAEVVATEKELQAAGQGTSEPGQIQQKQFAPDTPDYKRLDEQITKGSADLNVRKSMKNKELVERQSKMLLGAYREVQDAVKQFSAQYNIGLVIQYDSSSDRRRRSASHSQRRPSPGCVRESGVGHHERHSGRFESLGAASRQQQRRGFARHRRPALGRRIAPPLLRGKPFG